LVFSSWIAFSFLLMFLTRFSFSSAVIRPAGTAAGTGAGAFGAGAGAGAGAFAAGAFVVVAAVFFPPPPPLPTAAAAAAEGAFFAPAAPELAVLAAGGAIPGITLCRIALGTNFPTGALDPAEEEEEEELAEDLILPTGTAACFEAAISAAKAPVLPMAQSMSVHTNNIQQQILLFSEHYNKHVNSKQSRKSDAQFKEHFI
jgi:hypothetical protein